jgi:hypothetical protein
MSEREQKRKQPKAHSAPAAKNHQVENPAIADPQQAPSQDHPFSPAEVLQLQRTIGNRAVQRLIHKQAKHPAQPIKISPTTRRAIQRAIGFEFEFGEWKTTHNDEGKSSLSKGEEIIKGAGYKIEGEDSSGGSAIEVVTKPYTKSDEAITSIGHARKILKGISTKGEGQSHAASEWGGKDDVLIEPKGAKGKMQASPAIALDKLARLYAKQAKQGGGGAGLGDTVGKHLNDKAIKDKYLDKNDPSADLIGLVTLVVDYLEQGSGKGTLSYPKSAFKLMARTSFNKMFELVPEHAFFSKKENMDKWVNLVLEISARIFGKEYYDETSKKEIEVEKTATTPKTVLGFKSVFGIKFGNKTTKYKVKEWIDWRERKERPKSVKELGEEPVLGQAFNDIAPLSDDKASETNPEYKLEITRKDWLKEMFTQDLLSKENDKRFEGMGAYGGSTDVQVLEDTSEQATEKAVKESGLKEKVEMGLKGDTDTEEDTSEKPKVKQAPIFELRGMRDMLDIQQDVSLDDWEDKVSKLFTIIDEVNQGTFEPGGKPTIPPDKDNKDIWKST